MVLPARSRILRLDLNTTTKTEEPMTSPTQRSPAAACPPVAFYSDVAEWADHQPCGLIDPVPAARQFPNTPARTLGVWIARYEAPGNVFTPTVDGTRQRWPRTSLQVLNGSLRETTSTGTGAEGIEATVLYGQQHWLVRGECACCEMTATLICTADESAAALAGDTFADARADYDRFGGPNA
jgi:hypothetical protein